MIVPFFQKALPCFLEVSLRNLGFFLLGPFLSLELLAVLLDSKFFLKASACVELLDNRSHRFINKNYCSYKSYEAVNDLYFTCKIYLFRK